MATKLDMRIRNLELLLDLKSIILKTTDIDNLLSRVCSKIAELEVYDVVWAIIIDDKGEVVSDYSSNPDVGQVHYLCSKEALNTSELFIKPRTSPQCKDCVLSSLKEATLISKRLEYDGEVFGVFSVSIKNSLLDDRVKNQFIEFVNDISMTIHAIRLKSKNDIIQLELSDSRNMYRKLLDTSAILIGIMDLKSNVTFMSKSLKNILGFAEDDDSFLDMGMKGGDFVTESDQIKVKNSLAQVLKDNVINTNDYIFKRVDGGRVHMRLRTSLMHDALGQPSGFMVIFHDLSSEIKTAEELRLSEEKFRLLFMKAPNGVSLLSSSGVILDCNEHDAQLLQLKRAELIGTHVKTYLTPEHQQSFMENFKDFKAKGVKNIVVKLVRKDGSVISVARSVTALNNKDGSLRGIVVHSRDVTEEIKAQDQIKLLLAAIEQSSSVFTITDLEGKITYVNKRFTELTGFTFDEVVGKNPNILKSGKLSDVVYEEMWNVLMKGGVWKGELCNKRKDGELYWEYASMTAIKNADGELTNLLKVAEDITLRRQADQELKETTIRYHNIFNLVPNPIVIHFEGRIVDANHAAFLFSKGDNMKKLMGKSIMTFVHESSQKQTINRVEKLIREGGELPVIDANYVNLKGEIRNVKTVSKEVAFRGKRAFMVVFEDITEHKRAEQKVLESERKFRDIFNLHPDPISITDMDTGVMFEVNDAFLEAVDKKREDVIGHSAYDVDIYQDIEVRSQIVDQVKKHGFVRNYEVSFNIDGGRMTTLVSGAKYGGPNSNQVLFVARDISKLKSVEKELKETNAQYRNIFNMAPNPIIIHIKGKIVDVNRAALLFSKAKSRESLLGSEIMGFVHDSSRKEILNKIRVLNRGGKILPFDAIFLTVDGEERSVRTASNIISFGGEQAYMVFFEDITERKQAERKLIESEKRFRSFFDLIPDPVIITNISNGKFVEANKAALTLGNKTKGEALGQSVFSYGLYHDISRRSHVINELTTKGIILNEELELDVFGKSITVLASGIIIEPVEDKNVLFVARDISTRKQMEVDLINAKEKAEAGERLKSSFLSNISHEIRTPMNAILGFSDLLRDSEIEQDYRNQYINIIQQRGRDLLKMISDIMDISKIESGSLELQNRAVRIRSVIADVVNNSVMQLQKSSTKDITFNQKCEIDDAQLVNGDKYRIRQVLTNLLDNAIKFTQQGSITIRCWLADEKVFFEIKDTGCGIAVDKLSQAFERFVQVHDIKDVSIGGSGLGLSISRSLLKLMGGEIWIESDLGKGTTLSFSLNVFDGGDVLFKVKDEGPKMDYDWSGKTILIAEDEPSNQMFVKVILGKTKINIIMANDGKEAVELFAENSDIIDIVLVDVKMPELNGYEVTQIIKKQNPEMVVVALTANAMNNDREEALKSGCDAYLSKPIAKELLYSTLDKFL